MKNIVGIAVVVCLLSGCGKSEPDKEMQKNVVETSECTVSEEKQVSDLENAVEKEDFQEALSYVEKLKNSKNAVVRLRCVESIGWFGKKSVRALMPFLLDRDEDVRSEAQDQWDSAINDIEDEHEKGVLIEETMMLVRDREVMESISFQLNDLRPTLSIDIIVHLIASSNGVARAAAKEAYEYVTGDDWKNVATAQKWLEENQEEEDDE
ncbi:MAG: hypothetical protein MJ240_00070 [Kiritimatiellae bacterium]|nr:hypothetical protein [Kiritimatiellia bacterium]